MSKKSYLFTSESVTEGHPDKICDQISDAILDAVLAKEIQLAEAGYVAPNGMPADPKNARVACETVTSTGLVMVTGEIRTQAYIDVDQIVRETIREIGYTRAKFGFDGNTCGVVNAIHEPVSYTHLDVYKRQGRAGRQEEPHRSQRRRRRLRRVRDGRHRGGCGRLRRGR